MNWMVNMNVGVIGTGVMGKNHVRVYSELKGVENVYAFDMNKESASRMKDYGAIICDSIEELLIKSDAVSICVPTKYHFEVAKKVIERGKHCLIEKPIALSVKEGEEIMRLLKGKNIIVGVGHIERFNPIINEIKKILVAPSYVEIKRHNPDSGRITDVSVVEDLMIHDIDIVFNVLFEGKKYILKGAGTRNLCEVVASVGNCVVSLSASKNAFKKIRTIYVEDENFSIDGDFMNQEIYICRKMKSHAEKENYLRENTIIKAKNGLESERYQQESIIEKVLINKVEPLNIELRTFVECVIKSKPFPITIEQSLNNLKLCEEIKRCL